MIDEEPVIRKSGDRPTVVDDVMKIRIATLLATGVSLRQVGSVLGISPHTVTRAIAADPQLKEDIDDARRRAELHPLAAIIRESGRNWKAAVWLLDYLDKMATREQPREEWNREKAESNAAFWIQQDMAAELRKAAKEERETQKDSERHRRKK